MCLIKVFSVQYSVFSVRCSVFNQKSLHELHGYWLSRTGRGKRLEFGVGWEPFQRSIDIEVGKDGVAVGTFSGPALNVIAVDRDWGGAGGTKFTNAQAWGSGDGRAADAPGRGPGAIG